MKAGHRNQISSEFERILRGAFRKAGLRAVPRASSTDGGADLVVEKDGDRYLVELKVTSEGRGDRLIPLLSQAILQARAYAQEGGIPVAVVAAPRISDSVAGQIEEFGQRYAGGVGVGAIDAEGLRSFLGHGLEALNAKPTIRANSEIVRAPRSPGLFSDLNQWLLKVLIGQHLPEPLITVERGPIRNASQLAEIAGVSVMSASRLVKHLSNRGFLDRSDRNLQIVRLEDLLELWIAASRDMWEEIPARWILKRGSDQLNSTLRDYASPPPIKGITMDAPRCCLASFAGADALGYGFVRGAAPQIYLESVTLGALTRLQLEVGRPGQPADVFIRKPSNPTAVFRAAVTRDGLLVSDILQVWLDVSTHPARGREQAREIWRRGLKPFLG